jgi:hypothetical protein
MSGFPRGRDTPSMLRFLIRHRHEPPEGHEVGETEALAIRVGEVQIP